MNQRETRLSRGLIIVMLAGTMLAALACPPASEGPVGAEEPRAVRTSPATLPMEPVPGLPEINTEDFVRRAWALSRQIGDLAYLALQRASSADIQRFAKQILDDEPAVRGALIDAASNFGTTSPFVPTGPQPEATIRLSNLTGSNFDRAYAVAALQDHARLAAMFEGAASLEYDPALRDAAQRLLPLLRRHLRMAREVAARVGVVNEGLPDDSARARSLDVLRLGS